MNRNFWILVLLISASFLNVPAQIQVTCCSKATGDCKAECEKISLFEIMNDTEKRKWTSDNLDNVCPDTLQQFWSCTKELFKVVKKGKGWSSLTCCNSTNSWICAFECPEEKREEIESECLYEKEAEVFTCVKTEENSGLHCCSLLTSTGSQQGTANVTSCTRDRTMNCNNGNILKLKDAAKLQCCSNAFSSTCHKHCNDYFKIGAQENLNVFRKQCTNKLEESDLLQCLEELEEPCELGCQVLEKCSNFNDRSTEFFRTCNKSADDNAEREFFNWKAGAEYPGNGQAIPLLDISTCYPEVWKALSCVQQLKPCQTLGEHTKKICRSECESTLMQCVDKKRLLKGQSPSKLCELLSPWSNDEPCISLKSYLDKSKYANVPVEVTHPCVPNPCSPSEVCLVNRNCLSGHRCYPSMCVPGCKMGESSPVVVPRGIYIRVPNGPKGHNSRTEKCYQLYYCNHRGNLEHRNLEYSPSCIHNDDCWYNGKKISHNTQTKRGCDICICYAGELACTQMECNTIGNRFQRVLPCNCPDHYVPVCGANGKTYPSACLARCESLTDEQFEFGACFDSDPCSPNSCQSHERCVPRKRVCLSITQRSCKQYDCVDMQKSCNLQTKSPVCDKDNMEHSNLCWMLQKGKSLGHYGKCMHHCRSYGHVCGHNGETYENECAAWAERVSVDYRGACVAVGAFDGSTTTRCNSVKCSPLPSEHCPQVYPPGGCCPVCGAALRLMYSRKLAEWAVDAVKSVEPVVVQSIAERLREHVKILECDVFAFLSIDSIIALIVTITDHPTEVQIKACVKEAEKLELLIQRNNPRLMTELPLSFITTASMIEPVNTANVIINNKHVLIITLITASIALLGQQ